MPTAARPYFRIRTIGAGEGNRTLVASLEGWCFTIKLHPQPDPNRLHSHSHPTGRGQNERGTLPDNSARRFARSSVFRAGADPIDSEFFAVDSNSRMVGRSGFEPLKLTQRVYSPSPLATWVPARPIFIKDLGRGSRSSPQHQARRDSHRRTATERLSSQDRKSTQSSLSTARSKARATDCPPKDKHRPDREKKQMTDTRRSPSASRRPASSNERALELAVGFEPTTPGLQNRSSAVELR